ncbi:hypothetical protein IEQ34_014444 [Dendrobium chrysotoxum]|uniref:C2H2-type domain-containing protein n=1 Tax=Dendrobium chrysotoxum TaxID=161865 RepID=A0AAV7GJW4_DENCH|nr:hypothetical protein IEQ34_014444 [Dendrobium chrysotoxum]
MPDVKADALLSIARTAEPFYECLVEGCGAKLKSYKSRQQHLIDKHKFPTSFEFKKAKPSKHQRQNNQHKQHDQMKEVWEDRKPFTVQQKKYQPKKNPQNEQEALCNRMEVEEIDKLVSAVSKLSTSDSTPSNISFGRRHTRAFSFIPRSLRQNVKHQSDAME